MKCLNKQLNHSPCPCLTFSLLLVAHLSHNWQLRGIVPQPACTVAVDARPGRAAETGSEIGRSVLLCCAERREGCWELWMTQSEAQRCSAGFYLRRKMLSAWKLISKHTQCWGIHRYTLKSVMILEMIFYVLYTSYMHSAFANTWKLSEVIQHFWRNYWSSLILLISDICFDF